MELDSKFTALELAQINNQTGTYTCACPLHVSLQITNLRKLFDYQKMCMEEYRKTNMMSEQSVEARVHQRIAEVAKQAHQLMEQCLDEILEMEGWDRVSLEMPTSGIRKRIDQDESIKRPNSESETGC